MTLSKVLQREPEFDALPAAVPARVTQLLRVCLRKDPKQRVGDIRDVRLALEGAFEAVVPQAIVHAARPTSTTARALPWAVAGIFGVALTAALMLWAPWRSMPPLTPRRLLVHIGADASLSTGGGASAILSPDGLTLAFVAQQAGQTRLFTRKLDQLQSAPLLGTEGAASPFFSPDGQWIAFFAAAS